MKEEHYTLHQSPQCKRQHRLTTEWLKGAFFLQILEVLFRPVVVHDVDDDDDTADVDTAAALSHPRLSGVYVRANLPRSMSP